MIAKPQFTATPNTDSPVFLTWTFEAEEKQTDGGWYYLDLETNVQLQPQPDHYLEDAKITVYSWPHEGKKLTHVSFSWICFVELAWYVFRGG